MNNLNISKSKQSTYCPISKLFQNDNIQLLSTIFEYLNASDIVRFGMSCNYTYSLIQSYSGIDIIRSKLILDYPCYSDVESDFIEYKQIKCPNSYFDLDLIHNLLEDANDERIYRKTKRLAHVPYPIISLILSYANAKDIINFGMTCKDYYDFVCKPVNIELIRSNIYKDCIIGEIYECHENYYINKHSPVFINLPIIGELVIQAREESLEETEYAIAEARYGKDIY